MSTLKEEVRDKDVKAFILGGEICGLFKKIRVGGE